MGILDSLFTPDQNDLPVPKPGDQTTSAWYSPLVNFMHFAKSETVANMQPQQGNAEQIKRNNGYQTIDDSVVKGVMKRNNLDPAMPGSMVGVDTKRDMTPLLAGNADPIARAGFDPSKVTPNSTNDYTRGRDNQDLFGAYYPLQDRMMLNTSPEALVPGHYLGTLQHESRHRAVDGNNQATDMINKLATQTDRTFAEESLVRAGDYNRAGKNDPLTKSQAILHIQNQLSDVPKDKQMPELNNLLDTFKNLEVLYKQPSPPGN